MGFTNMLGSRRGKKQHEGESVAQKLPKSPRFGKFYRPRLEQLEGRTLLSGPDYTIAGQGLQDIFSSIQTSLNTNLLNPVTAYNLPLVGTSLGTNLADPVGQFLGATQATSIVKDVIKEFGTPPSTGDQVQQYLSNALQDFNMNLKFTINHTLSQDGTEDDFQVNISNFQLPSEKVDFQLGLPGLQVFSVSLPSSVTVTGSFSMNLYFGINSNGVFVNPTSGPQNDAMNPLLHFEADASFSGLKGTHTTLNGVSFTVTDTGSGLKIPVNFNEPQKTLQAGANMFMGNNALTVNVDPLAAGDVKFELDLSVPFAITLFAKLNLDWPLGNTQTDISPFANITDSQEPTVGFDIGANLDSFVNPLNGILSQIESNL